MRRDCCGSETPLVLCAWAAWPWWLIRLPVSVCLPPIWVHRLLRRTAPVGRPGLWYIGEQELAGGEASGKMDHLVCFLPGAAAAVNECLPVCLLHSIGWVFLGAC